MKATALVELTSSDRHVNNMHFHKIKDITHRVKKTRKNHARVKITSFKQYVKFSQYCRANKIKEGSIEIHSLKEARVPKAVSIAIALVFFAFSILAFKNDQFLFSGLASLMLSIAVMFDVIFNPRSNKLGYLVGIGILNPFNRTDIIIEETPTYDRFNQS